MLKRLFCVLPFISPTIYTLALNVYLTGTLNVSVHRIHDEMSKTTTHHFKCKGTDCQRIMNICFLLPLFFLVSAKFHRADKILRSIVRQFIKYFFPINDNGNSNKFSAVIVYQSSSFAHLFAIQSNIST